MIISKLSDSALLAEKMPAILKWRKVLLGKVNIYINGKRHSTKVNALDPTKEKCLTINN